MEAAGSAQPPPPFDYPLVHKGKPSHRPEGIPSLRPTECGQEVSRSDQSSQAQPDQLRPRTAMEPTSRPEQPLDQQPLLHLMQHISGEPLEQEPIPSPPRDEECSTEAVATIAGGYPEGITRSAWKAQLRSAQQEVNPTGMIRLPVRLGDKTKSRGFEVDFLVVNVPTAYNGGKEKTRGGGYTSVSPPSSCSSSSEAPASASRGLVASSPAISRSVKEGINSTSSGSRPFAGQHDLAKVAGCVRAALLLGLHQPRPSPVDDATLSSRSHGRLDPPALFHSAVGTARRAPLPAGTPQQPLPLERRPRPWLLLPWSPWGDVKPHELPSPRI
ncbi:LOW QUALITY PROTEIN: hypothetical protein Cgig2_013317 [Carnegiea gigantea]|uniref:Uncharacterized protein n=1 Tax=Carnegiea gigantea TaxID=171969 RepID=A0A9Q1JI49_9CARY|nr:LOW QUALITY PROTEIN: hypothetical protein Cgig2_013317 [Carnegiea gigantea]